MPSRPDLEDRDRAPAPVHLNGDAVDMAPSKCAIVTTAIPASAMETLHVTLEMLVMAGALEALEKIIGICVTLTACRETSKMNLGTWASIQCREGDPSISAQSPDARKKRMIDILAMVQKAHASPGEVVKLKIDAVPDSNGQAVEMREPIRIFFHKIEATSKGVATANWESANSAHAYIAFQQRANVLRMDIACPLHLSMHHHLEAWVAVCKESMGVLRDAIPHLSAGDVASSWVSVHPPVEANGMQLCEQHGIQLNKRFPDEIEDILPSTPIQRGFILMHLRYPHLYRLSSTWQVQLRSGDESEIDINLMQQAWETVVQRHQILRTIFVYGNRDNTNLWQVVLKSTKPQIIVLDAQDDPNIPTEHVSFAESEQPPHLLTVYRARGGTVSYNMSFHHAIADITSVSIINREFMEALDAQISYTVPLVPQYGSFVRYLLEDEHYKKGLDAWADLLSGVTICHFPCLTTEPSLASEPVIRSAICTEKQSAAVHKVCNSLDISTSNFFRAIWALVLRCFTGSDDVCFGALIPGRNVALEDSEHIVGPLATILTCRAQIEESMSVATLLQEMMNGYLQSLPFQHCALPDITQRLGVVSADEALFNTLFHYMNEHNEGQVSESVQYTSTRVDQSSPMEFDVTIEVRDEPKRTTLTLKSGSNFMQQEEADRLLGTFQQTINSVLAGVERSVAEMQCLGARDIALLQSRYADSLFTSNSNIHSEISRQVALNSKKEAICSTEISLTYSEMDHLSYTLAGVLLDLGVQRGSAVCICMDKSVWATVAMLAVLKTGGLFVPLDPMNPPARLQWLVSTVQASVLLLSKGTYATLRGILSPGLATVLVEEVVGQEASSDISLPSVNPANSAYIVFTSGSTGTPKGVVVSHGSVCGMMPEMARVYQITKQSRALQFSTYNFDAMVCEIFVTLMVGGTVIQPTDVERMEDLSAFIPRMQVNFMFLTPTVLRTIHFTEEVTPMTIITAGEVLGQDLIDYWIDRAVVINSYGPTESTVCCSATAPLQKAASGSSIGKAFGSRAWIVSPHDLHKLVPIGGVGELIIEGPNLADRYYGDQAKTDMAFIQKPLWAMELGLTSHYRFYRTGDLVRQMSDGSLIYLNRIDTQVKVRGQRVELGEIEYQLAGTSNVEQGLVLVPKKNSQWSGHLIAIVCLPQYHEATDPPPHSIDEHVPVIPSHLRSAATKTIKHCRQKLEDRLPSYMVPTLWFAFTNFPRTSSGKTDRLRITRWLDHAPSTTWAIDTNALDAMQTRTTDPDEQKIQKIWAQALGVPEDRVGIDRSFLNLGGNSVLAMQVAASSRASGLPITFQMLLQRRTIAELAIMVKAATQLDGTSHERSPVPNGHSNLALTQGLNSKTPVPSQMDSLLGLDSSAAWEELRKSCATKLGLQPPEGIEDIYPCSPMQQGMILAQSKAKHLYHGEFVWKINTTLPGQIVDIDKLRQAWLLVIKRHPTFRTRFVEADGAISGFLQVVLNNYEGYIQTLDIDDVGEMLNNARSSDIDIATRPFEITIYRTSTEETFCSLSAHHAIFDDRSMATILHDLVSFLNESSSEPNRTGPAYRDFMEYFHSQDHEAVLTHWHKELDGTETCLFPVSKPASFDSFSSYHQQPLSLTVEETTRLKILCQRSGMTLSTFFQTIWAIILRCYTGSDSVCFGTVASGRDVDVTGIQTMVGPLLTLLVSRVQVDSAMDIFSLMEEVQRKHVSNLPYQHCSLGKVFAMLNHSGKSLFNSTLNLIVDSEEHKYDENWLQLEEVAYDGSTEYDVTWTIKDHTEVIEMSLDYWQSCLSDELAKSIAHTLTHTIRSVITDPYQRIIDLDMVSAHDVLQIKTLYEERWELICDTVHGRFQRQVKMQPPDKLALSSSLSTLTYEQLDNQSTSVAHILLESGVSNGSNVPFCLEKSISAIIMLLGILKAGATFVPLDPEHPVNRLEWLIDEIEADVLICSAGTQSTVEKLYEADSNKSRALRILVTEELIKQADRIPPKRLPRVDPLNIAYIMFTSGSTGNPKGVMVSHQSACGGIQGCAEAFQITSESRSLQFAGFTWDAMVCEIFSTLHSGGTIHVPSETQRMDALTEFVKENNVNWMFLTPTVLRLIVVHQLPSTYELTIVTIGEVLGQDLIDLWRDRATLINAYGPTESTIACTATLVTKGGSGRVIGTPFGSQAWIVQPGNLQRLAPIGSVGELFIEGPNIAQGYFKDASKTAAAFIQETPSWAAKLGVPVNWRMYRTGDLVRQDTNGSLTFLLRADSQTKINGQRIELGEVEHHLLKPDAIRQSVALVPKEGPWQNKLVAIVVLQDQTEPESRSIKDLVVRAVKVETAKELLQLQQQIEETLPMYMVPTVWIPLEKLPVLSSSKVNRSRLSQWLCDPDVLAAEEIREWATCMNTSGAAGLQPTSLSQKKLQEIWADALKIPEWKVTIDRSFLSLGGDSISAMYVASTSRACGIDVSVYDLIRRMTIAEIVPIPEGDAVDAEGSTSTQGLRLSALQKLYLGAGGMGGIKHSSMLVRSKKKLSLEEVNAALPILVNCHPALRTCFREDEEVNDWVQYILNDTEKTSMCEEHHVQLEEDIESISIKRQAQLAAATSLNLFVDLIHLGSVTNDDLILITIHSLLADEDAWQILVNDLEEILYSGTLSKPPGLTFQAWMSQEPPSTATKPVEPALHTYSALDFWGLPPGGPWEDMATGFSMTKDETFALQNVCNKAFRTSPTELIAAATLDAFERAFTGRKLPLVWVEKSGRHYSTARGAVPANTIALMKNIIPVVLHPIDLKLQSDTGALSLKQTIITVKDAIRGSRPIHTSGSLLDSKEPVELFIRSLHACQMDKDDERLLLQPTKWLNKPPRVSTAVFEIGCEVKQDILTVQISHPAASSRQAQIQDWIRQCKDSLQATVKLTAGLDLQPTLQDYPLLQLNSYSDLDKFLQRCLAQADVARTEEIEDIYPCSPLQEGILLTEAKSSTSIYDQRMAWHIQNAHLDASKLQSAWQSVVNRHAILRTIFLESPVEGHYYVQVVKRNLIAPILWQKVKDVAHFERLQQQSNAQDRKGLHQLIVYETKDGQFFCTFCFHHVLADAGSVHLIRRDLQLAYSDQLQPNNWPSYASFIVYLLEQDSRAVCNYWKQTLKDAKPCELPRLIEASSADDTILSTEHQEIKLTSQQLSELRQVRSKHGITTSVLFNTIWTLVLRAFLGREDICFGYLASGREIDVTGIESMIGPLITVLICYVHVESTTRLVDLAHTIQERHLQNLEAQHYSLAEVYHELGLQGDRLFNTAVNVVRAPDFPELESPDALQMCLVEGSTPSEFDAWLEVVYDDVETSIKLRYSQAVLTHSLASSMLSTISRILEAFLGDPEISVGGLQLCSEEEQQQFSNWTPSNEVESEVCLHQTIEQQMLRDPESIAMCTLDNEVTYFEMWALTNQLAHHLVSLGVGPNMGVPFCFDRSKWSVIAMVGILKAGAATVPLNPMHSEARLRYMIELVDSPVILTSATYREALDKFAANLLVIDDQAFFAVARNRDEAPVTGVRASDAAHMLFSFTTNEDSKASVLTHKSVQAWSQMAINAFGFGPQTRTLHTAPYIFDTSIQEVVGTLMFGGCVCIPTEENRLENIASTMEKMKVNSAQLTPTVLRRLHPARVPHLKTVGVCASEEFLAQDLINIWSNAVYLYNTYGPEECSVFVSYAGPLRPGDSGLVIGKAHGVRLWLVDPNNIDAMVPIGAIGEILIEGAQLGKGYYKDSIRTADVFVEKLQWALQSSRKKGSNRIMFRTGDLARFNDKGNLVYFGRKDHHVQLRGRKVELSEVESYLTAHSAIHSAAAIVPLRGWAKDSLVAVVVMNGETGKNTLSTASITLDRENLGSTAAKCLIEVKNIITSKLPNFMAPSIIVPLHSIPLLSSGKIDRPRLKHWLEELDQETADSLKTKHSDYEKPGNHVEEQIRVYWGTVLDLPRSDVGTNVSFLSLGGDSISAMKVVSQCRLEGLDISVQDLLRRKTIAQLAASITNKASVTSLQEPGSRQVFNLSPIQASRLSADLNPLAEGLVLGVNQSFSGKSVYNAVQTLVRCHAILQTSFQRDLSGDWKQHLVSDRVDSWLWYTHQVTSVDEVHKVWMRSMQNLKLENSPVFAADLVSVKNGSTYLLLVANKLIVDPDSWRVIVEDLNHILCHETQMLPASTSYHGLMDLYGGNRAPLSAPGGSPSTSDVDAAPRHPLQIRFTMDASETKLLTGICNAAFRTKTIELVMAAVIDSFRDAFSTSRLPNVLAESNQRKIYGIDGERTIGLFTSVRHLDFTVTGNSKSLEFGDLIKRVKDEHRSFDCSHEIKRESADILFRIIDEPQRLEGQSSCLYTLNEPFNPTRGLSTSHVLASCEILPLLENGLLSVAVNYSGGTTGDEERVINWMEQCQKSLRSLIRRTESLNSEASLSDFLLLKLHSYSAVDQLVNSCRIQLGVELSEIVDIYPCSPMQEGMLLAQFKTPGLYRTEMIWQAKNCSSKADAIRLESTWLSMVHRHAILRTRFVDAYSITGSFVQVVLATPGATVKQVDIESSNQIQLQSGSGKCNDVSNYTNNHVLTIFNTKAGEIYVKLAINHTVYDKNSFALLMKEFTLTLNGKELKPQLPPYRDFISYLCNQQPKDMLKHWQSELFGMSSCKFPITSLDSSSAQYVNESTTISPEQTAAIRKICREANVTVPTFFRAVWTIILRCYTGVNDTCFGAVASGREIPVSGVEEIMGPMLTLLVCREQLEGSESFLDVLGGMQEHYLTNLSFQHCSLAQIYKSLGLHAGEQLFNTTVNFKVFESEHAPTRDETWKDLEAVLGDDPVEYDLSFTIEDHSEFIDISLAFWSSSLSIQHAQGIIGTICKVLKSIIYNPAQQIDQIELCEPQDDEQVPRWKYMDSHTQELRAIHERIAHQAHEFAAKTAVSSTGLSFTYQELDHLSNRLAHKLVELGVRQGDIVPFLMEKSVWAIVAMLGILKAGAAFLPLGTSQPSSRVRFMVKHAGCNIIVCSQETSIATLQMKCEDLQILTAENILNDAINTTAPLPKTNGSDTAYIIYTSGSTGEPKGIVVSHQSACGSMKECAKAFRINGDTKALQFSAYTWDAIICEVFATLDCGGTVFVPNEAERLNGLVDYIERERLNWLFLTPTVLRLIPHGRFESQDLTVVTIGEVLNQDLIQYWHDKVTLINAYGPTETCVACTAGVITSMKDLIPQSVGYPFGARAWVTSPKNHHRLMPIGSVGELLIEGPSLADGYYKDPHKTAESFVYPQWARNDAYRFYKTGDLVRQNGDGSIIFISRKDAQVKVNGQRVELGEIEHHILKLEGVQHAVAMVPKDGPLRDTLVAVVSFIEDRKIGSRNINSGPSQLMLASEEMRSGLSGRIARHRRHLESELPTYMVPTHWIALARLPFLTTGKIDRHLVGAKLSEAIADRWVISERSLGQTQPTNPVESAMQEIWADILGIPASEIGTDRSFISLGGDSISAIKIASRCRAIGIAVTVQDLLRRDTIKDFASQSMPRTPQEMSLSPETITTSSPLPYSLLKLSTSTALDAIVNSCCSQLGTQATDIEDIYPCSPMQEGILLAQARAAQIYDQRLVWKVSTSDHDVSQVVLNLLGAWKRLTKRHTILRTRFVESPLTKHHFIQVVLRNVAASVSKLEIDDCVPLSIEKLTTPPTLQKSLHHFSVCRTSQHEVYCILDFTHSLGDIASVQILAHELCIAYENALHSAAPSYSRFISFLLSQDSDKVEAYWVAKLRNIDACLFPQLATSSQELSLEQQKESLVLDALQLNKLRQLCSESKITLASLFSTVWAAVLSLYIGRDDVCFGYVASGRDINVPGVEEMIGPLITLLVGHAHVDMNCELLSLAQNFHEEHVQALTFQHYSSAKVYHALGMAGERLFNTLVNMVYMPDLKSPKQSISMTQVGGVTPSEFEISLDVVYTDMNAHLDLNYDVNVLTPNLAFQILKTMSHILTAVAQSPNVKIGQIEVCDEKNQALLSAGPEIEPPLACVHEVIRQRTLESPHAEAICAHDGSWTYNELWELSDHLAVYLIHQGVTPNTYVPFCFEKSKWAVVAILSILKAGGCCVALDPSYPKARLQSMISQVEATIAIASPTNVSLIQELVPHTVTIRNEFFMDCVGDHISPSSNVRPDDPAYAIFTSGSTGEPKACILEHQSLQIFFFDLGRSGLMSAQSRVLQFASYTFDVSIEEVLGTLSHGGCICIPSDEERLNDLAATMEQLRVNWSELTPSTIRTLTPAQVPHLRTLLSGGEALGDDLIPTWAPVVDMFNTYGPSECAVTITYTDKLGRNDSGANLGKGLSSRLWLVNSKNHDLLVPPGAVGEILAEGRQVGRGYLKRPEQTAAAFIQNPVWSGSEGKRRMYKTGDLGRLNEDGSIMYLGRKDQQVKIRGQRIELAEIEYRLSIHPVVESAIVAFPQNGHFKKRLVAIIVSTRANGARENVNKEEISVVYTAIGTTALSDVFTSVERSLPRHMVPWVTIPIASMPLLLSGKINRRALTRWLESLDEETIELLEQSKDVGADEQPTSATQVTIRDVWSQLLELPPRRIGVHKFFFSLGGDSILAMQMSSRLREHNLRISVQHIFEQQTISKLAAIADFNRTAKSTVTANGQSTVPLGLVREAFLGAFGPDCVMPEIENAFPCSAIQETILHAQESNPDVWTGVFLSEVKLEGAQDVIDLEKLGRAWLRVLQHHSILRTIFVPMRHSVSSYCQVILKVNSPSCLRMKSKDGEADRLTYTPINIARHLPPNYLTIKQTVSGATFLELQLSHALYDAPAMDILMRNLQLAYNDTELASSTCFGDHVLDTMTNQDPDTKPYWRSRLRDYVPQSIFADESGGQNFSSGSTMATVQADFTHLSELNQYCKTNNTTLATLFQCAWALCLRKLSGKEDVCFGSMTSTRELATSRDYGVVGPCINVLPSRVQFTPYKTIQDHLKLLQKNFVTSLAHQQISVEEISEDLRLAGQPLFDTYLNVRRIRSQEPHSASGMSFQPVDSCMLEQYPIVLYAVENSNRVELVLSHHSPRISNASATKLLDLLQHVLQLLIESDPTRQVIDL